MATTSPHSKFGTRGKPEESRAAILKAALEEFAEHGIAGARTDAIARAARVNKALLYYYFKDKDALYEAAIERVFRGMLEKVVPILDSNMPPREKILTYVGTYFDHIAANPRVPRMVQSEWMRPGTARSQRLQRFVKEYSQQVSQKLSKTIEEGVAAGDFRPLNPMDFIPSMVALVVFYFSMAPMIKNLMNVDPLSPQRIAERRAFVLDFISHALFVKPQAKQGERR